MKIAIAQRNKPYSHTLGISILLPGTFLKFKIFPALIKVFDISNKETRLISEHPLNVKGPVDDFTVVQDLEKGLIRVWGRTQEGFIRYRIEPEKDFFRTVIEKRPHAYFSLPEQREKPMNPITSLEKISFGIHKAQDWDLIWRRCDPAEFLPLWHRLGLLAPQQDYPAVYKGTVALLSRCKDLIDNRDRQSVLSEFVNLFLAGFEGGLVPRLKDENYLGFGLPEFEENESANPMILLTQGAQLIRSLFVQADEHRIKILPVLPVELHCGRVLRVECGQWGVLDLEWTKGAIRRMVFEANNDGVVEFLFPKEMKRFRLRHAREENWLENGSPISLKTGVVYFFDRFEK